MNTKETKLMIIHNYIDWFTSDEKERESLKANAALYVDEDHVDEIKTKNPDLKVLRVAVVPTETGNGIDQSSSVEEILACDETELYSVADYFKAQNDEEFGIHWSFLINIETNEDLTGMNTDGIDYHSDKQ